mmetsp:Transcript_9122/g.22932  ORF Transcript_9122/g.22932 Transcript_9122/m.22932 type:complete len:641 (-) Transcript_9122:154-2076(-)
MVGRAAAVILWGLCGPGLAETSFEVVSESRQILLSDGRSLSEHLEAHHEAEAHTEGEAHHEDKAHHEAEAPAEHESAAHAEADHSGPTHEEVHADAALTDGEEAYHEAEEAMAQDEEEMVEPKGHTGHMSHVDDVVSVVVSIMLVGAITFQLTLFYLVNHKDEDIKRYAWETIGMTISIFCAVLIFTGLNEVLEHILFDGLTETSKIAIGLLHALAWFVLMQILILQVAQMKHEHEEPQPQRYDNLTVHGGNAQAADTSHHSNESLMCIRCKAFGGLTAHISGFASIHAWAHLQHEAILVHPALGLLVVPLAAAAFAVLIYIGGKVRKRKIEHDGELTPDEEVWAEVAEENENDVAALCLAYLITGAVTFTVTQQLHARLTERDPSRVRHHDEHAEHHRRLNAGHGAGIHHTTTEIVAVCAVGFVFAVLVAVFVHIGWGIHVKKVMEESKTPEGRKHTKEVHLYDPPSASERMITVCQMSSSFTFAWCLLFACHWFVDVKREYFQITDIFARVIMALGISALAFVVIYIMDKLSDSERTAAQVDRTLRTLITAFGVLVGFTWEHAFAAAVTDIAEHSNYHELVKLLCSCVLVAGVFPAHSGYVVPKILQLQEENSKRVATEEMAEISESMRQLGLVGSPG